MVVTEGVSGKGIENGKISGTVTGRETGFPVQMGMFVTRSPLRNRSAAVILFRGTGLPIVTDTRSPSFRWRGDVAGKGGIDFFLPFSYCCFSDIA
jgi:hypothetical protein